MSTSSPKFIVTVMHNGQKWPLRNTVWAYSMDRAQVFDSAAAAKDALFRAQKFMQPKMFRAARIEEVAA